MTSKAKLLEAIGVEGGFDLAVVELLWLIATTENWIQHTEKFDKVCQYFGITMDWWKQELTSFNHPKE